jgi:Fe-S-cluster-containing hydrogenase component 2
MKLVQFHAQVQEALCAGDKLCEAICPSGAIQVVNKKAQVEIDECVACTRCSDRCPNGAITITPLDQPRVVAAAVTGIDEAEIHDLCLKAHRLPDDLVCICTGTVARELAAAVIKGARSVRDVVLMTGAVTGCQEFCVPVVQRMLKAYGVNIAEAGGPLTYEQTFSLWDMPRNLWQKYPTYKLEDDTELATKLRKG